MNHDSHSGEAQNRTPDFEDMGYRRANGKHIVGPCGKLDISYYSEPLEDKSIDSLSRLIKDYFEEARDIWSDAEFLGASIGRSDSAFLGVSCRMLYRLREAMGHRQFEELIENLDAEEQQWRIKYKEEKQSCEYFRGEDHDHIFCRDNSGRIDALESKWPELSRSQIGYILGRTPFIGMTIDHAEEAFGSLHFYSRPPNSEEKLCKFRKCPWGLTDEKWLLTFQDGKLVKIDDIPRSESSNSAQIAKSREQTKEV